MSLSAVAVDSERRHSLGANLALTIGLLSITIQHPTSSGTLGTFILPGKHIGKTQVAADGQGTP